MKRIIFYIFFMICIFFMIMLSGCHEKSTRKDDATAHDTTASGSSVPTSPATALYDLAMLHYRASDLRQALFLLDSALLLAKANGDDQTGANALNMMGSFCLESGDTAQAVRFLNESLQISRRYNYYRQIGVAYTNLALVEAGRPGYTEKLKQAKHYFILVGDYCPELGMLYNNLGTSATNPDTALFYLQKAVETGEINHDHEVTVLAYNNMAYSYMEKNDDRRAASCLLDQAIPLAIKTNDVKALANLYDSYADVLLKGGNDAAAAKYLKKSLEAFHQARIREAEEQTRLLMTLLDVRNKEITIREQEARLLVQDKNIQRLWMVATALVLMAVSSLLFAHTIRLRGRIRMNEKEKEHARRLLELEMAEKQRVAMQLHDLIGPVRNILLKQDEMHTLSEPATGDRLRVQLTALTTALRSLSHQMNGAMLGELTLGEAMDTLRQDFPGLSDSSFTFEINPDCRKIQGTITSHLFFILLELMTNAMKYAVNSTIHVSITAELDNLYLIYRDNGPGFSESSGKRQGIGISNIRTRAAILRGQAHLETSPGAGTVWTISVPCQC